MEVKSGGVWAALTLFFLAPTIGELLSGSAPPAEFFNPFTFLILSALYGSGAVLVRELSVRWGTGWSSIFILGAAYAIIEEALMVKSFFDPNWMDLGILRSYGRWAGVNWVWTLELTIYHAVVSIAIPILLVELIFPSYRGQTWLWRRGMIGLSILLASVVIFGFLALTPYRPPLFPYLLSIVTVILLYRAAKKLPPKELVTVEKQPGKEIKPGWFVLLGFGATFAFFFVNWGLPSFGVPVLLTIIANVLLVAGVARQTRKMSQKYDCGDHHWLGLASGSLGFFILLTPILERDASRTDDTSGMTLVGLAMIVLLIWLWRRVERSTQGQTIEATA